MQRPVATGVVSLGSGETATSVEGHGGARQQQQQQEAEGLVESKEKGRGEVAKGSVSTAWQRGRRARLVTVVNGGVEESWSS